MIDCQLTGGGGHGETGQQPRHACVKSPQQHFKHLASSIRGIPANIFFFLQTTKKLPDAANKDILTSIYQLKMLQINKH